MRKYAVILLLACIAFACSKESTDSNVEKFRITTVNVDGLPKKIVTISVNPDGPGEKYTKEISQFLSAKGSDFIAVQENFNYNDELKSSLDASYNHDTWSGGIFTSITDIFDLSFKCDGLGAFWKKDGVGCNYLGRTKWKKSYGKFDHAWDEMVTKGFRRYQVTTAAGNQLVIINLHMDASDSDDEKSGADAPDREARLAQWQQLRDYLLENLGTVPIIIAGDTNSYYSRDNVSGEFIQPLQDAGAEVGDVWIMLHGKSGESLDKILYINPAGSAKRLVPSSISKDKSGYKRSDSSKPLGDHYPLTAVFKITDRN